jgi:IPT/TIG domain
MAQSALTVTPPSPTPPTNMSFTGSTPPNPPNYTKNTYNDPKNWSSANPKDFPPPYFDDGTAGSLIVFAANTAALASGSAGTAGGTEGTYPGAAAGAVPASTSVAHEGAGTEVVVTQTYGPLVSPSPNGALQMISDLGAYTLTPNTSHASSLSAAGTSTISSLSAGGASGTGTTLLTVTGTNFRRDSVVNINGVPQTTNFASATSISVTNAPKRATAGNTPVTVTTGGVTTAPTNWVFT